MFKLMIKLRIFLILSFISLIFLIFMLYIVNRKTQILLKFSRKGSFTGFSKEITIYHDGKILYINKKENKEIEERLLEKDLVTLKKLVSDVKTYCNKEFRAKSGAADYFTYEIIFDGCKIN